MKQPNQQQLWPSCPANTGCTGHPPNSLPEFHMHKKNTVFGCSSDEFPFSPGLHSATDCQPVSLLGWRAVLCLLPANQVLAGWSLAGIDTRFHGGAGQQAARGDDVDFRGVQRDAQLGAAGGWTARVVGSAGHREKGETGMGQRTLAKTQATRRNL